MKRYQAIFFDFDGVLADSMDVKTTAFAKLFEEHGPDVQQKVVDHHRRHGGMSRYDKFVHYYSEFLGRRLDQAGLDELCQRFSSLVVDEVIAAPEIPGVSRFLEKWSGEVPCFVVSATPTEEVRLIVRGRGIQRFFTDVLGSPASKADNLRSLLGKHELMARECLFLGDAEGDYRAAMDCGVDFIGIKSKDNPHLAEKYPDVMWVSDFLELLDDPRASKTPSQAGSPK
ncbi:MAG: HAD family hydrolase [Candidatus Eisenbacteria sp.]|nr:HAD family hydrolase [Candidatus Eisenbacteria bacterium]